MPKLESIKDLARLREKAQQELKARHQATAKVTVGMGTCGIAAGARETLEAILQELETQEIYANVATVGCIGMCSKEPLVDIARPGELRTTYANVHPDMVPHLIEEHLVNGNTVHEWAFGRVPLEGIGTTGQAD